MRTESPYAPAPGLGALPEAIEELSLPYLELDRHGIVVSANRAARALHHPGHGALIGKMSFSMIASNEEEPTTAEFASLMESGDDPPVILRAIYDRTGRYRTYQLHRSILRDPEGRPAGMRIIGVDVSEAQHLLEEIRRRNLWLESVLDSIHEAVIATDAIGIITGLNTAAEMLLGWKAADLVGKTIEEGIQIRGFESSDNSFVTFVMGLNQRHNGLATLVDRQGREVPVRVWSSPVIDKSTGFIAGVVFMTYKPGATHPVQGAPACLGETNALSRTGAA
jgi:PAS domain S-box-containing protein